MITRRYKIAVLLSLLIVAGSCLIDCTRGDRITGGSGSTTTNGFTATIVNEQGVPMSHTPVRIRPDNYCAADIDLAAPVAKGTVADTFTGSDGTISRANMEPGSYTIEAFDATTGVGVVFRSAITYGPVHEIGGVIARPTGAISGALDVALLGGSALFGVQVYGMERIARIDSVTGAFLIPGLPPADYTLRLICSDTLFQPVDLDPVAVASMDTVKVHPYAAWEHTATVSITPAVAGLSTIDTLYNFPLLLRLTTDNFDFSTAKKKGEDLRVTKSDGSAVPFEHEWWDSANAVAALWILIDTLYGCLPVQKLNLYWGNHRGASVSQPSRVFTAASGFDGVWHLNESGGTLQIDATVNRCSGTPLRMDGSNDVPGIIGRAQQFKNDSQCIEFTMGGSTVEGYDTAWTVSLWVKASKVDTAVHTVFTNENMHCRILLDTASRWVFYEETGGGATDSCFAPALVDTWVNLCGIRRGTRNYLYVNGAPADSCVATATAPSAVISEGTFRLGSFTNNTGWFFGVIDEFRMYDHAISDTWVRVCHETQRENQRIVVIEEAANQQ